jgi:phosphoglycolate phosphatase-like HAD superfamily hydrolase
LAEDIDLQWFKTAKLHLYSDVKPVLTELKRKGFKLGLITDCYRSDLEKMLPKLGIQELFDVSFVPTPPENESRIQKFLDMP